MDYYSVYKKALLAARQEPPALEEAYNLLRSAAEGGEARAVYALATWYMFGNAVVDRDEARGFELLDSISNANIAEAMFDLAVFYDYGRVVELSEHLAFSYYMKAALLGDTQSCAQVAEFYREGKVVEQSDLISSAWKLRAEQSEAQISPPYRMWLS